MAPPDTRRTPLADKIARLIRTTGPITVADYFDLCLSDPEHGYYRTRDPFGQAGDFITAPEITQLFGEMIGLFLVDIWRRQGLRRPVRLVEIGPGRGTLMRDVLRVVVKLAPEMTSALTVHLVETSAPLTEAQRSTLAASGTSCEWHATIDEVPQGYTLLVANEFFDALPVHQFVKALGAFRERVVALDDEDALTFIPGPATADPALLPADADAQPDGTIFEIAPAREAVMRAIAGRMATNGGAAVIVDYGHLVTGYGDTLQAVKGHRFDDPLAHPGEADLTSHVDFEALACAARTAGAHVAALMAQGDFLVSLGLLERAGRFGAGKSEAEQEAIRVAVERIAGVGAGNMGELFKVMVVTGRSDTSPAARTD